MTKFTKILEPYQIRQVKLRNRMVCLGHTRLFAADDASVSDVDIASYGTLSKGGVGMIILEMAAVDYPLGLADLKHHALSDDKFIPGFSKLTQAVHGNGCPIFLQLTHAGPAYKRKAFGLQPVAPSSIPSDEMPLPYDPARELTTAEIEELVVKFAKAAERARKAGFDGVEVHGAHPYLVNSFFSRVWNKRQDAYGCQDLASRARFAVEIIRAIKQLVGSDFPVGIRINGQEWGHERATTAEESQGIAKLLEAAGADYISVSGWGYGPYSWIHYPDQIMYPEPSKEVEPLVKRIKKPGLLVPLAEGIKRVVTVPVITSGRLDPKLGEWILRQGKADLIGMVRRFIADPEIANKVASGRLEEVRPCLACVECSSKYAKNEPVRCRVNATIGRELEYTIEPAARKKRVLVVGGGPSGLEAARVAALRGHEVILYERERKIGGLLPLATMVKGVHIEDIPALIRYFRIQLEKLGVKVRLGTEVTPELIESIKPDAVIIAAGGTTTIPEIPGIDKRKVIKSSDIYRRLKLLLRLFTPGTLRWLTKFWMPIGNRVVIVGGLIQGCQLAEFLVKRNRKVTIVETSGELGTGIPERNRLRHINWLASKGVTMLTGVKYEEITDEGLVVTTKEGQRQTIVADSILTAMPLGPNTGLGKALEGKFPEVHLIGDCSGHQLIIDAIYDGFRVGHDI